MDEPIPWHRMFGMAWMDSLHGLPATVEMEKDLSLQRQHLDVLILKKSATLPVPLPDGFDDLAAHNLITFKSFQEAMSPWALTELLSHFVLYRKMASPSTRDLLPVEQFRLYAVCVRSPEGLAERVPMVPVRDGVYDVPFFLGAIRLVVVNELPFEPPNALFHLFSAREDAVRYGAEHYHQRSPEMSTLFELLFDRYREAGLTMNELQELHLRMRKKVLAEATPDELRDLLTPEERLKGLPAEERLKGLPVEALIAALPPDLQEAVRRAKASGPSS